MLKFSIAVIGKGLVQSAAAKYLPFAGEHVPLINPDEPIDSYEAIVFARHYDSGRVDDRLFVAIGHA